MAMHALAEGYLIKGDFGQAECFEIFFPGVFFIDESNLELSTKVIQYQFFNFLRLYMFSLQKKTKKMEKGWVSFIPNGVCFSLCITSFIVSRGLSFPWGCHNPAENPRPWMRRKKHNKKKATIRSWRRLKMKAWYKVGLVAVINGG